MKKEDPETRFWRFIVKRESGCWEWTGAVNSWNYGRFYFGRDGIRLMGAHRFAFTIMKGPIPNGLLVCHRCDNSLCCNPDHLFLGTVKDNNDDCKAKGRAKGPGPKPGVDHYKSKWDDNLIRRIRAMYADGVIQREIASQTGVGYKQVWKIVHRILWKHVA